jgi:hypothetical protein
MANIELREFSLERMFRAVEIVRERLLRATAALESAGVPYAVIGGHAVAAWVSRVDAALVRNTQDVDLLIRRGEFGAARAALERAGFVWRHSAGIDMFLDKKDAKARDAVHVVFAAERVHPTDLYPTADVLPSEQMEHFRAIALESLVRMKLTSYRLKDQVHLQDLTKAGLIDESWLSRLPADLAMRLKPLIDNPNG